MSFIYNKAYARPQEYNLWNVDNTSDVDKPITSAQRVINASKLDVVDPLADGAFTINQFDSTFTPTITLNCLNTKTSRLILQENNNVLSSDGYISFETSLAGGGPVGINRMRFKQILTISELDTGDELIRFVPSNANQEGDYNLVDFVDSNRQINAQPIRTLGTFASGSALTLDLSIQKSLFTVVNDVPTTLTMSNPYGGKVIKVLPFLSQASGGPASGVTYQGLTLTGTGNPVEELVFNTQQGFTSTINTILGVELNFIKYDIVEGVQRYMVFNFRCVD